MKNYVLVIIILMTTLGVNTVAAQNTKKYYDHVELVEDLTLSELKTLVNLSFNEDVPKLTAKQYTQLLKDSTLVLSSTPVKGYYKSGWRQYVFQEKQSIVYLSNATVIYKDIEVPIKTMHSWWTILSFLAIIVMFMGFLSEKKTIMVFSMLIVAIAAAILTINFVNLLMVGVMSISCLFLIVVLISGLFASLCKSRIFELIFMCIYCILLLGFILLSYFQL